MWNASNLFLQCKSFVLKLYKEQSGLSLPTLVPQALFVSILSGESKELIAMMKARGYSSEKATGLISIRIA